MRKIVFLLFFIASAVQAQQQTSTSLFRVDSSWTVDPKTRIGSINRIKATQQNPLPYCFSTAAAMLYDQTNCNTVGRCEKQTSFLAITQAGQGLENTEQLDPKEGGSPFKSVKHLLTGQIVEYDKCNYANILRTGLYRLTYDAKAYYENYHRYKQRAAYLSNYYRYLLKNVLEELNPRVSLDTVDDILQREKFDLNYVTFKTLLTSECFETRTDTANKYSVKFTKIDSKNIKPAILQIESLLRKKKPIIVSFCPTLTKDGKCSDYLHSLIIVAQARVQHQITGDRRTAYWLVNSWGEEWQEQNSDGWVYADRLLEALVGELIWLE